MRDVKEKAEPGIYLVDYSEERFGVVEVKVLQEDIDATQSLHEAIENAIAEDGTPTKGLSVESWEVVRFRKAEEPS